jgi:hypothetical protein
MTTWKRDVARGGLVGVRVEADDRLRIELRLAAIDGRSSDRVIDCEGVVAWSIGAGIAHEVVVRDEHPALLAYREDRAELFFSGGLDDGVDPDVTAALLRQAWSDRVGHYVPFEEGINAGAHGLPQLLAAGFGQVARGPASLMIALAEVLAAAGATPSIVDAPHPDHGPAGRLEVLLLGPSWVVARRFTVEDGGTTTA